MTDMKRITVSMPDDIVDYIADSKGKPPFKRDSTSEIIRKLLEIGIAEMKKRSV